MSEESELLTKQIRNALSDSDEWSRVNTSVPGIYVVRMPDRRFRVSLMFNPPDPDGNPKKRKGLYFDTLEVAVAAREAFSDPALKVLVEAIRAANNTTPTATIRVGKPKVALPKVEQR